jgi:hypothetical protein
MRVASVKVRALFVLAVLVLALPVPGRGQTAEKPAAKEAAREPVLNRARFFPAPGREQAMVGGKFTGSIRSASEGFVVLGEITEVPKAGDWSELSFPNKTLYRWIRYEGPPGSYGAIAEVEFYSGKQRLKGAAYGPFGERQPGRSWNQATNGDPKNWFEGATPDGQFVGLDLGESASARTPRMDPAPGDPTGAIEVALRTATPGAAIRYSLDGTVPGPEDGVRYARPIAVGKTTTLTAVAFKEGLAPSPPGYATYLVGAPDQPEMITFHLGNSLTGTTARFADYARTAGYRHRYVSFTSGGAKTNQLWDFKDGTRKDDWEKLKARLPRIDHLTFQPRDFNLAQEVDHEVKFLNLLRKVSPDLQPWLYTEWVEKARQRPSDKGLVPSYQMKTLYPALTWEESMSAMLLYMEELQHRLAEVDHNGKRARVLPSALAMGWIKNMIDRGKLPGAAPGDFYPLLFRDQVHPNDNGGYLVDMTWFAAFYRESPVDKVLPVRTTLTAEQAAVMQRLAWDVVKNYPDCGLYETGSTPVAVPEFAPGAATSEATAVTLSSATPGAWFRYSLDGTKPTRDRGYVYCGVVSVRPGMTLTAVAYKSGMADSPVAQWTVK